MWTIVTKKQKNKPKKIQVHVQVQCPMTKGQTNALEYVSVIAHRESNNALDPMSEFMKRVQCMGMSTDDLFLVFRYIRDCVPLVIHVNIKTLGFLASDTHYRNQFETKTSGGKLHQGLRTEWENEMFNGSYNGVIPFDRCKYGCFNTNQHNSPIACAGNYGDNYFVLKSHIRHRVTSCYGDSSNSMNRKCMGTLDNYAHVLALYSDDELKNIVNSALKRPVYTIQSKCQYNVYREIQIHGPVTLSDFESLIINRQYDYKEDKDLQRLVEKFRSYGINIVESDQ